MRVADAAEPVEDQVVRSIERQRVRRKVRELPRFEGKVLALRYGLGGDRPVTVRECAEYLRCSPALIHKTEHRALSALRDQYDYEEDAAKVLDRRRS
ncbi:MAG: hypothetical protein V9E83_09250 [Baekduia sp.]